MNSTVYYLGHEIGLEILPGCPFCNGTQLRIVRRARRIVGDRRKSPVFYVQQCQSCGLTFTNPRPLAENMGVFYKNYFSNYLIKSDSNYAAKVDDVSRISGLSTGRILDVGCGTGAFLNILRQRGWETYGIEPDPVASDYARNHYNLQVITGTLDTATIEDEQFDIITLWHVLEHVYDPISILDICFKLLKPSGWLFLELPNFGSLQSKVFRNSWYALMLPEHLFHFTPQSLEYALRRAGFTQFSHAGQYNNAGWGTSLRIVLSDLKASLSGVPRVDADGLRPTETREASQPTKSHDLSRENPKAASKYRVAGYIATSLNRIGFFVESKILRMHFGTMNQRVIARKPQTE